MEDDWIGSERRQHPRARVKGGDSLIMIPKEELIGTLIDISMGGISFHYAGSRRYPADGAQSCILFGEDDLWLEKISLVTVKDTVVTYPLFPDRPCLRRRSMMFRQLSSHKKTFLQQYIWLNAADTE